MLSIGDTVKVHYTGKYLDGTVFDSTLASEPISFTIGDEMMLPKFEKTVQGMKEGEHKTVKINAADAYGEYDPDLLVPVNKKEFFADKTVKKGDSVQMPTDDGVLVFKVHEIQDDTVILDANSEMAGKDVIFDIELVSVVEGDGGFASFSDFEDEFNEEFDEDEYDINDGFTIEEY